MADNEILRMRPTEVAEASARLDVLAARMEQLMQTENPNLTVPAGARDEVSQRVAATLNGVHDAYGKSMEHGATEMRDTAATLRAQADGIANLDDGPSV
ncbi:PE domain-containing protein [Mycobacterium sp. 21AC1]|uniref:PE domain-containing protein n=1 Tax=[Mycobacterium] appelbergii TaxID=2939269 RepID=UPI002938E927|nr:PE domain-containing protein [Mycobacterium sp. 21AC1]MDV3128466.1 PE domain-containing protein [Mycobacterium sp. 21AC1]